MNPIQINAVYVDMSIEYFSGDAVSFVMILRLLENLLQRQALSFYSSHFGESSGIAVATLVACLTDAFLHCHFYASTTLSDASQLDFCLPEILKW